jgi:hypothetical protein
MQLLNGAYTQWFNRRHNRVGHLVQGRFKAILVEKGSHLLELARYVVLNPVRAKLVRTVQGCPWTSFRATSGQSDVPELRSIGFCRSSAQIERGLREVGKLLGLHFSTISVIAKRATEAEDQK